MNYSAFESGGASMFAEAAKADNRAVFAREEISLLSGKNDYKIAYNYLSVGRDRLTDAGHSWAALTASFPFKGHRKMHKETSYELHLEADSFFLSGRITN